MELGFNIPLCLRSPYILFALIAEAGGPLNNIAKPLDVKLVQCHYHLNKSYGVCFLIKWRVQIELKPIWMINNEWQAEAATLARAWAHLLPFRAAGVAVNFVYKLVSFGLHAQH